MVHGKASSVALQSDAARNLKAWFGRSKLVSATGHPMVVYHGSRTGLESVEGDRFWVTPSRDLASSLNGRKHTAHPVYVKFENPFDAFNAQHVSRIADAFDRRYKNSSFHDWPRRIQEHWKIWDSSFALETVAKAGFDAIYTQEDGIQTIVLIGDLAGRVKSVKKNSGTYDSSSSNIYDNLANLANNANEWLKLQATKLTPHA